MNKQISFKLKQTTSINQIQALNRAETKPHRGLLLPKNTNKHAIQNQMQTLQAAKITYQPNTNKTDCRMLISAHQ